MHAEARRRPETRTTKRTRRNVYGAPKALNSHSPCSPRLKGKTALPLIEGAPAAGRLLEAVVGLRVKPVARPERAPKIAPELSGIPEALVEAIRRRSRRGLS